MFFRNITANLLLGPPSKDYFILVYSVKLFCVAFLSKRSQANKAIYFWSGVLLLN